MFVLFKAKIVKFHPLEGGGGEYSREAFIEKSPARGGENTTPSLSGYNFLSIVVR